MSTDVFSPAGWPQLCLVCTRTRKTFAASSCSCISLSTHIRKRNQVLFSSCIIGDCRCKPCIPSAVRNCWSNFVLPLPWECCLFPKMTGVFWAYATWTSSCRTSCSLLLCAIATASGGVKGALVAKTYSSCSVKTRFWLLNQLTPTLAQERLQQPP